MDDDVCSASWRLVGRRPDHDRAAVLPRDVHDGVIGRLERQQSLSPQRRYCRVAAKGVAAGPFCTHDDRVFLRDGSGRPLIGRGAGKDEDGKADDEGKHEHDAKEANQ
jgi:hypothetical protein